MEGRLQRNQTQGRAQVRSLNESQTRWVTTHASQSLIRFPRHLVKSAINASAALNGILIKSHKFSTTESKLGVALLK